MCEISEKKDYNCGCKDYLPIYKSTDDNPPRNPHCTLHKLCNLLEEKISQDLIDRHLILLDQAIKACKYGFFVQDLKYVTCIIEKIAERIDSHPTYIPLFKKFLSLCEVLPLTNDISEKFTEMKHIEEYMSMIGFLLIWLSDIKFRNDICKILHNLLKVQSRLTKQSVTFDWIEIALEGSHLPEILIQLSESSNYNEYQNIINIILLVSGISSKICQKMVCVGAMDTIMLRFEAGFSFLKKFHCSTISDINVWIDSTVDKSVNILMNLIDSLTNVSKEFLKNISPPCRNALWCLRFGMQSDIIRNRAFERNHKCAFLIKVIQVFPNADYIGAGFVESMLIYGSFTEITEQKIKWIDIVYFKFNDDFILFKKMALIAICCLAKQNYVQQVMRRFGTMLCLVSLISIKNEKFGPEHCISLAKTSFHVLYTVGLDLLDEFIKYDGTIQMLMIIESYFFTKRKVDNDLIELCFKTLLKFLRSNNEQFLTNLKNHYGFATLSHFIKHLLSNPRLTMHQTKLLSYCFVIFGYVCEEPVIKDEMICLMITYMKRIINPREMDSHLNVRTVISAIDLLWKMVTRSSNKLTCFIENCGVYTLLDMLVEMPDFVKMIGLGCLIDMCENTDTIEFLLTWRGGVDRTITIYSFLINLFDRENFNLEVQLTPDKIIKDLITPLMGKTQCKLTFESDAILSSSPTVLDLYGSSRPKVFAMLQILDVRNSALTKKIKKKYKISSTKLSNFSTKSYEDVVVLTMAKNYLTLKIGEAWNELKADIHKNNFKPVLFDREMLNIVINENIKWISFVKEKQLYILRKKKTNDETDEQEFYNLLRNTKIQDAIDELRDMQFIARSADRMFMLKHKYKQIKEIKQYLTTGKEETKCFKHKTFFKDIDTSAVFHQKLILEYN